MINEPQALNLLEKYGLDTGRIAHSKGVASFAFDLAGKINKKHPELGIDPQKVYIAGLLHDIGRSRSGDHELNTVSILHSEGLETIAKITIHGSIYEIMLLRGIDNPSLKPRTIENKIVAYADARFKDHLVSMLERWDEIETRRSGESEKIASLSAAKARFFVMEKELLDLLI